MRHVVVTGVSAITPLGHTAQGSFEALIAGRCGIAPVSLPCDASCESRIAGEVKGLDIAAQLGGREARRHARYTQLALIAAREALACAGWSGALYRPERVGCVLGVGMGGLEAIEAAALALVQQGARAISPMTVPLLGSNMGAGMLAAAIDARGPCWSTNTACASGAHAIGQAMQVLRSGAADAMICGGAEACVRPLALTCFARMGALSTRNDDPRRACRPFDRSRDGFVMAEGAALLVLEVESAAVKRGAPILGRVAGYAATADAFHATRPRDDGQGAVAAMRGALADADLAPAGVGYINAHGTGTKYNDAIEAAAIHEVFGARVPVSSTKGATGHMLGAAGAFEAVVCLLAMQRGMLPPTLNLEQPDEGCTLDLIPNVARAAQPRAVLSNSFGFGGQNASLVLCAA